jgi:hypothetical protein
MPRSDQQEDDAVSDRDGILRQLGAKVGRPERQLGRAPLPGYTAEQRLADAKRWAEADAEDERNGWGDTRRRIQTAFAEQ